MPTLIVANPAADRRLITVDAAKTSLGISGDAHDAWLLAEILTASDAVADACGIAGDSDGDAPATFLEEEAVVTFAAGELPHGVRPLRLPWRYPARVKAVSVGGVTAALAGYRAEPKGAMLYRLNAGGGAVTWDRAELAVTIRSGWPLNRMHTAVADAVTRLVRLRWESKDRDLAVKAEETASAWRKEYWVGSMGKGGSALPDDVRGALYAAGLVNVAAG